MAVTIKWNMWKIPKAQPWYEWTRVLSARTGQSVFLVSNLPDGSETAEERLKVAAEKLKTGYPFFRGDTNLRIQKARAYPFMDPTKAVVIAHYAVPKHLAWDPIGDLGYPNRITGKTLDEKWWTVDGSVQDEHDPSRKQTYARPFESQIIAWDIEFDVSPLTSPLTTIAADIGKTNSNTFTMAGHNFVANTLLFLGAEQKITNDGVAYFYQVTYKYRARFANPDGSVGWLHSYLSAADTPATRDKYTRTVFSAPPSL